MARSETSEYAGTGGDGGEGTGRGESGPSTIDIAGIGSDGDGGTGSNDSDIYQRNADGSVKRNADGSPRKKRGRKTGSGSGGSRQAKGTVSVDGIDAALLSMSLVLAASTKVEELALDPSESKALAEATAHVASFYPTTIAPETMAWMNLGAVFVGIGIPRFVNYNARKGRERAAAAKRNGDNILGLTQ